MFYSNTPKQYAAYTTANHTVNKTRQVVMLYDGAIRYVTQAKDAIERGDIQERYNSLKKATSIISGMQGALDFANGGDIAKLLDEYYYSIYMRLMSVHQTKSTDMCVAVINELKMMRSSWQDVDNDKSETIDTPLANVPNSDITPIQGLQVSI